MANLMLGTIYEMLGDPPFVGYGLKILRESIRFVLPGWERSFLQDSARWVTAS
jgi:hypothetical protein